MRKYICLVMVILCLTACSGSKAVFSNLMMQKIVEKNVVVSINTAHPMSGSMIVLTSPYSLKIKGDSVFSYLPYYGRAYSVPYGGGNGLNFNDKILSYSERITTKGMSEIIIGTKNNEDTYRYVIYLSPTGSASIDVSSYNRQSISFTGSWE